MMKWIWLGVCLFCTNGFSEPLAKVTAKVVDEAGIPIKDAKVSFVFNMYQDEEATHTGTTDTNGVYTIEGETTMHIYVAAEKEGFYKSGENYYFKARNETGTRYEPWGVVQTLTLRSIIDPKEGKKSGFNGSIPKMDEALGFDVVVGDWVVPYGKGVVSDFVFTCSNDTANKVASYVLTFPNAGDGIIEYPRNKKEQSIYRWPHSAPLDGYSTTLKRKVIYTSTGTSDMLAEYGEVPRELSDMGYIFRARTHYDENGSIDFAYYGKIKSAIATTWNDIIGFSCWLNTDSHSRSLESTDPYSP